MTPPPLPQTPRWLKRGFAPTSGARFLAAACLGFCLATSAAETREAALRLNGFDLSNAIIPVAEILRGGTAMVFDREVGGRTLSFGVPGLLYPSDVLTDVPPPHRPVDRPLKM